MIDQLRQMAIFAKAIDHGSFRGAARELRLSPSVVSHHISQLEERLGVALIYRSTRKLSLTHDGERLLAATRNMIDAVEGELQALTASATSPSGELRITIPSVLSQSPFTERLAALTTAYPRLKLHLDFSDTRRELIEDGFDLAIRMGPNAKPTATSRVLFSVDRIVVASSDFMANRPEVSRPKDIENWEWLALTPVQNLPLAFTRGDGGTETIRPDPKLFTNDAQALYRLARAHAGLAIVPDFLADRDLDSVRMQRLLPDWSLPAVKVSANWPANAPKHGLVHLALDGLSAAPKEKSP